MTYQVVVGLEIHAQLLTNSKAFCPETFEYGGEPNTRVSVVSLAHPGALPSVNWECVRKAIKVGLATHCTINETTWYARKNYFYPDLPKGYQITQDTTPFCVNGFIDIRKKDGSIKRIRIQRIHMEEDAGKSIHDQDLYDSLIDLNRCGVGLIEIVSAPDLRSAEEAAIYLTEIRKLVRYLEVCDGNMEEGSLRCDANISIMPINSSEFGQRVEVKNINSISNVARAINYEIERQTAIVAAGGKVIQETRSWDSVTGKTVSLREKEGADDYRYFPEPDLLPVVIHQQLLNAIAAELPELPEALFKKYTQVFGLPEHDAILLTEQKEFAQYYEQTLKFLPNYKLVSNWLNGPVKSYLNEYIIDINQFPITPEKLAEIIRLVEERKVSNNAAKEILFPALLANPTADVPVLAQSLEILLVEDTQAIQAAIQEIINQNREKVQAYLGGKTGLLGFLVGQVMKQLGQGKADPKTVNTLLTQVLEAQRSTN